MEFFSNIIFLFYFSVIYFVKEYFYPPQMIIFLGHDVIALELIQIITFL